MKKLFGIMFAGYVALLNAVAYAQQGMTQEMADNLNARNEDQSAFMIIWLASDSGRTGSFDCSIVDDAQTRPDESGTGGG